MDLLIAQITTDLRSSDALRQSSALLQALQQCAAGRDVSALARTAATEILSAPSSAVCKRLALDLLRALPLPPDLLDPLLLTSLRSDLSFPDPDVAASSIASFPSLPSHLLPSLLSSAHADIAAALSSPAESLRLATVTSLSSLLPRDDLALMCSTNPSLMAHATTWWGRLAELALDSADAVSAGAFEALARLFQELEGRRMSRLAGDKLVDGEGALAVRAQWAADAIDFIWSRRNMLIARTMVMPVESFRVTVFPLVHAAKMVASGVVNTLRRIAKPGDTTIADSVESSAEKLVGVSDIVSHLLPFLSSLDPPLVFEVGINMLSLADVPGGKPEWASAAIIAILTLWDRQEFSSMRETIVRAVVTNLHLLDLGMQILNLTELELNRVDIRVGLSGALYYMDGFSRTVRHLRNLVSQDPVQSSVTVGVSHFERCSLWVQVLYYPFYGTGGSADYEGDYAEEDSQMMRQKRSLRPELGEPVVLRCQPYKIPLAELLLPLECSPVEYFRLWPSLPAMVECTGTYTYEGSGFKATAAQQYDSSPFLSGLKAISSKPFHQVCSHFIRTVAGFQLCYAAKTWFGGFVGMMIFGASEVSRNVDLGDETTTMICKFVVRASDESITREIESDLQGWLDDITDGAVEYMPEDEVKSAAAERLKISMERIALLKAAKPKVPPAKTEQEEEEERKQSEELDGFGNPKGPSTLSKLTAEEAEHRALQAAVLQEWHQLCKEKAMKAQ
nr:unnamed protein product [Digitaria exilis]